jgi:hypothetical protein
VVPEAALKVSPQIRLAHPVVVDEEITEPPF